MESMLSKEIIGGNDKISELEEILNKNGNIAL